ncbi:MAG: hypothetical protein IPI33_09365 [Dehalococcoidia bacterium]|nr:hypothetical protein [Dehalococcoidia bacterium]
MKRYWGWEVVWMLYTIANSLAGGAHRQGNEQRDRDGGPGGNAQIDAFILFLAIGALVWHYPLQSCSRR